MPIGPVKFAQVAGNNNTVSLVAAVAGQKVVVLSYQVDIPGAAIVTIQDITADTKRLVTTGVASNSTVATNAGTRAEPLFETAIGEGLEVVTSAAVASNVSISYLQGVY